MNIKVVCSNTHLWPSWNDHFTGGVFFVRKSRNTENGHNRLWAEAGNFDGLSPPLCNSSTGTRKGRYVVKNSEDIIPAQTMPLTPGTKIGPYEISAPLGAGGMGE